MELKEYYIFISHSWEHKEHYEKVSSWLDEAFHWHDYSVSVEKAFDVSKKSELKSKLKEKIKHCNCILIMAGMYDSYSEWIDFEIETAAEMGKTIIGVMPWGNERIPQIVTMYATEIVGWNSASVVEAVKKYVN